MNAPGADGGRGPRRRRPHRHAVTGDHAHDIRRDGRAAASGPDPNTLVRVPEPRSTARSPDRRGACARTATRRAQGSTVGLVLYALALGGGLGLASADYATRGGYPFGGVAVGAWTAWPRAGSVGADPYTRAVNARRGEIPLAVGEGLLLTAAAGRCRTGARRRPAPTASAGVTPPARAWTLTVAGRGAARSGAPPCARASPPPRSCARPTGGSSIILAPEVQPGNWLPMPARRAGRYGWRCASTTRPWPPAPAPSTARRCRPSPGLGCAA